ncbi:GntR family transcriptional regulator [Uliginosibacterium sp. 31-12]|uniref:GntR family transcriptional regulator n=1 Tax=Uliginosibacterium sp. 31-12 TaxID=3062781 RepID=UPI0026E2DD9C|nr:GntR family transcriptional regulator [Uliginosibacterium sp. 31-12]MDO6388397.1 GntR family transcriptional regulator [Uliginosibacterium sp. 31-12]
MNTIAKSEKSDIAVIAERITNAVMEHRLPPGVKLAEERLAEAFKVSRTKVRHALTVLAKEGLVTLYPNRGAFVASPSVQDARELFATRRLLEPEVVRKIIDRAGKAELRRLRAHIAKESEARLANDRRALIKLSGEFHMLLAKLSGNPYISKLMDELCPLTCLIIALYDSPQTPACPEDEHIRIVEAIELKDEATAVSLMLHHLQHVENELKLSVDEKVDIDWEKMFA